MHPDQRAKLRVLLVLYFAFLLLLPVGIVSANSGPHGGYGIDDTCSYCHRTHGSRNKTRLLQEDGHMLCLTCHGSGSTGAFTNVDDGVFMPTGDSLLGGGFRFFKAMPTTSTHNVDNSTEIVWGSELSEQDQLIQNIAIQLSCTTCHSPHGGENYRLLVDEIHLNVDQEDFLMSGELEVLSNEIGGLNPGQDGYIPDYTTAQYFQGLSDWCASCHTKYTETISAEPFDALDGKGAVTRYRRHEIGLSLGSLSASLPLEQPDGYSSNHPGERPYSLHHVPLRPRHAGKNGHYRV